MNVSQRFVPQGVRFLLQLCGPRVEFRGFLCLLRDDSFSLLVKFPDLVLDFPKSAFAEFRVLCPSLAFPLAGVRNGSEITSAFGSIADGDSFNDKPKATVFRCRSHAVAFGLPLNEEVVFESSLADSSSA